MRIKYIVFLFIFLLLSVFSILSFSALNTGSGSGSMNPPSMIFKEWRVGRGVREYTFSIPIHKTFITSTQTSCWVSASVGYNGNQPQNTAPINPDTVSWSFPANHGMELDEDSVSTSWSGPHPSKLSGYTSFNVVAQLNVPRHDDTSQYPNPNTIPAICTDARNDDRNDRTPRHRGGTPMEITIKFTAQTTQGNTVTKSLPLDQDETDQIRQEYLDLARQIPARGSFDPEDFYDFGHYDQMINEDLQGKHDAWVTAINERERQNLPDLTRDQLVVTSGYRNPHHNVYHSGASAVHGLHQYGLALDVRGMNIDNRTGNDQQKMADAAENADPAATRTILYPTGHVHADWRGSPWPPANPIPPYPTFSLPEQSTDTPILGNANNNGNAAQTPLTTTPSATLSPTYGSYTASAGGSHSASLSVPSGFNSVYWYVASPSDTGLGTNVETDTGTGSTTSASFSYNFPANASGDYVITAYTYLSDGTVIQPSYTVTVGSATSTSSTTQTDTTDCPWCTDGCVSCATEAPLVDPSNPDCPSCGGANFYICVKCGETFDTCYSHIPNCSVELPSGDFWHSSVVWW